MPEQTCPMIASVAKYKEEMQNEKNLPAKAFWGLASRRMRWSLSWKGWLVLLLVLAGMSLFVAREIQPFLAVTDRIDTDTLVVEGWLDQVDLVQVVKEFNRGNYQHVFTTGGPVHGLGRMMNMNSTAAYIAAQHLIQLGIPQQDIEIVPSYVEARDRTYGSAVALRNWIQDHHLQVPSFMLITLNTHARRSRLLFEEAFDGRTKVGVVAIPNTDYDDSHWWRYSEGVKEILSEGASYLYVLFLFHPAREPNASAVAGRAN
jgi:uncharacterized SAM-binding protein YcdF (DUF218 family)